MEMENLTTRHSPILDQYVWPKFCSMLISPTFTHTGWFTGLSGKFLSARTARVLVLAGAERLDKELMIGQMQGKLQLVVLANVGHLLHEVSVCDHV